MYYEFILKDSIIPSNDVNVIEYIHVSKINYSLLFQIFTKHASEISCTY